MPQPAEILGMNESELVERAKNGCAQALTELVHKYHQGLRAFLVRRVGNLTVADDLAQDVFLVAFKQLGTIEEEHCFRAWLFQVARNKAVDYLRRSAREKGGKTDIESLLAEANASRIQQQNSADDESVVFALRNCISKLNPESKALIDSIYFQRIPAEKLAAASNRKSSAIRMALLRIRKALATCIRGQLGAEFEL
jgi:RNA polymerase sigma-70 factor (ECF subfamily)